MFYRPEKEFVLNESPDKVCKFFSSFFPRSGVGTFFLRSGAWWSGEMLRCALCPTDITLDIQQRGGNRGITPCVPPRTPGCCKYVQVTTLPPPDTPSYFILKTRRELRVGRPAYASISSLFRRACPRPRHKYKQIGRPGTGLRFPPVETGPPLAVGGGPPFFRTRQPLETVVPVKLVHRPQTVNKCRARDHLQHHGRGFPFVKLGDSSGESAGPGG